MIPGVCPIFRHIAHILMIVVCSFRSTSQTRVPSEEHSPAHHQVQEQLPREVWNLRHCMRTPTVSLSGKFRNVPSLKKNTSAVILPCMSPHYIKNCWQLRHKAAIHQKLPNWLSVFLKPSTQNHPEHPASLNLCSKKPMCPSQSIASKYGSQFLCSVSWLFRAAMDKTSLKPPLPKNK